MSDTDTLEQSGSRVAELEARNRRLAEAVKAAGIEIDALTYSIAHDLRTPLMHIDGFAHLLQSSPGATLDAESRDYLERIVVAARNMGALIGSLVDYSRVNSAVMVIGEVDLEVLLDEALARARSSIGVRDVQWLRSRLPVVRGDEGLLRQVLDNLVSNAVKYTAPRQPAVIEIGWRAQEGGVTVFVKDNGVGFDLKYAKRLFSPYQRMHSSEAFPGIGMGLAKARRILARHGGRIWVEAAVDQGATFYFHLPADVEPQPE